MKKYIVTIGEEERKSLIDVASKKVTDLKKIKCIDYIGM